MFNIFNFSIFAILYLVTINNHTKIPNEVAQATLYKANDAEEGYFGVWVE